MWPIDGHLADLAVYASNIRPVITNRMIEIGLIRRTKVSHVFTINLISTGQKDNEVIAPPVLESERYIGLELSILVDKSVQITIPNATLHLSI